LGWKTTPSDYVRIGDAQRWSNNHEDAIKEYRKGLAKGATDAPDVHRKIAESLEALEKSEDEIRPHLEAIIGQPNAKKDDISWAIIKKANALLLDGQNDQAAEFLERIADRPDALDLAYEIGYLRIYALYLTDRMERAEQEGRLFRSHLNDADSLHADMGWLLGRISLESGRPNTALGFFEDVLNLHYSGRAIPASYLGVAESAAALGLIDKSVENFEAALKAQEKTAKPSLIGESTIVTSLMVHYEQMAQEGHFAEASKLATFLVNVTNPSSVNDLSDAYGRLAQAHALRAYQASSKMSSTAGDTAEAQKIRQFHRLAAEAYEKQASLQVFNRIDAADALWEASRHFRDARSYRHATELLKQFVGLYPQHSRTPAAFLSAGEAYQEQGMIGEAVEHYREAQRRFPSTIEASQAVISEARCLIYRGPDHYSEARKVLNNLRNRSGINPQASEFRDSTLLLAEVNLRLGDHDVAIVLAEEALARYGAAIDPVEAHFLLAEAYKESAKTDSEERDARLTKAALLYGEAIDRIEAGDLPKQSTLMTWLQSAYQNRAECVFETGNLKGAIDHYEQIVLRFPRSSAAMSAFVQIVNAHNRLGQLRDARTAAKRAQWLLAQMPDSAFGDSVETALGMDRQYWLRLLGSAADASDVETAKTDQKG
jgi:tetratricopeptide (TPR) repeat protein